MAPASRVVELAPLVHRLAGSQRDIGFKILLLFGQRRAQLFADSRALGLQLPCPGKELTRVEWDRGKARNVELVGVLVIWLRHSRHYGSCFAPALCLLPGQRGQQRRYGVCQVRMSYSRKVLRDAPRA